MRVLEKAIKYSDQVKIKWWYLTLLILGTMVAIVCIVDAIVL
jgi:hypothetical protein